ncbi:MAG: serine/threonine protein kinase, partial [Muribaculaceae bacterium]|nr:serine/threonine protein kinase [Muribaculaceae bacterium]
MKLFYEKYIKIEHIGRGANADVFKVKHAEWGDVSAIKVLNNYIESKSDRAYESFLKECKTLLSIGSGQNPNILRIYGADLIDNHAIVEMDYVQGKSLYSYVKEKGFFDYEEVESFIHDIVGALAYTHHDIYKFLMDPEEDNLQPDPNDGKKFIITPEKEAELVKKYGIAHNDLHSNNVMRRDYDGRFILLDFGLAVQDGKCIKSSGKADGHPEYMAPEKFDSGDITPRSDVYSLGVLMFEVLTGRPPFILEVDNNGIASLRANAKIRNEHLSQTPPSIITLRAEAFEAQIPGAVYERDYPEWLDEVVMKCLAKNPEDRYADAKELLDDINWHISHERQDSSHPSSSPIPDEVNEPTPISPIDTDKGLDELDFPKNPRPKTNKTKLLFIAGGCVFLMAVVLYYILSSRKEQYTQAIDIPQDAYILDVGDTNRANAIDTTRTDAIDTLINIDSTFVESMPSKGNKPKEYSHNNVLKPNEKIESPADQTVRYDNISIPGTIQETLNMLINGNISREARLNSIPEINKKFFEHDAMIRTVSDSDLILDNENVEDFLRRIVLSRRISRII